VKKRSYPKFPSSRSTVGRPREIPRTLKKHLREASHETYMLNHYLEVFLQFRDIVTQSGVVSTGSDFWEFCRWGLIGELVHRLIRICEGQPKQKKFRVHAFQAFLMDLKPYASVVTRERFVEARPNTPNTIMRKLRKAGRKPDAHLWYLKNQIFSEQVGKTKSSLTEADIDRDLRTIRKVSARIVRYRNKQLAHISAKGRGAYAPSVDEIVGAIKVVTKLVHKYSLLVQNESSPSTWSVDITNIFLVPWIDSHQIRTKLQLAFKERQNSKNK
jgi:hypothetical protein